MHTKLMKNSQKRCSNLEFNKIDPIRFTALSFKMSWLDFPKPYFIGESQCKEI